MKTKGGGQSDSSEQARLFEQRTQIQKQRNEDIDAFLV